MRDHNVSGLAIVDDSGKFVGNFSMSALRSIMVDHLAALALPVIDFIHVSHEMENPACQAQDSSQHLARPSQLLAFARASVERRGSADSQRTGAPATAAALSTQATFEDFLDAVVGSRVHRVYIVDGEQKPVAVATLTDLMFAMAQEVPPARVIEQTGQ